MGYANKTHITKKDKKKMDTKIGQSSERTLVLSKQALGTLKYGKKALRIQMR